MHNRKENRKKPRRGGGSSKRGHEEGWKVTRSLEAVKAAPVYGLRAGKSGGV